MSHDNVGWHYMMWMMWQEMTYKCFTSCLLLFKTYFLIVFHSYHVTYYYLYLYCLLFNVVCFEINWIELNWTELNWTELNWTELNWTELNWTELNWTELNWTELNWTELNWTELNWIEYLCVLGVVQGASLQLEVASSCPLQVQQSHQQLSVQR